MMHCAVDTPYRSGRIGGLAGEPLRPGGLELTRRAMQLAGFGPGKRVLDLGCGEGAGTQLLRRWGCEAIGLDLAPASLASAAGYSPGQTLVAASAENLPFADGSLDGILAECSLSLVEQRQKALAECCRALRPGGRLAVTDMFARGEVGAAAPLPGCLAGLTSRGDILAQVVDAGFQVERWEDHSAVLRAFMARLIFETGSLDTLWDGVSADAATSLSAALRQCRPGYFLLVATKMTRRT